VGSAPLGLFAALTQRPRQQLATRKGLGFVPARFFFALLVRRGGFFLCLGGSRYFFLVFAG